MIKYLLLLIMSCDMTSNIQRSYNDSYVCCSFGTSDLIVNCLDSWVENHELSNGDLYCKELNCHFGKFKSSSCEIE